MSSEGEQSGGITGYPEFPHNVVLFGPKANCTLELCPLEASVYQYRPSLPANIAFLGLFGLAMVVHIFLGIRWKSWWFTICMLCGCLIEIAGYVGRVMMYSNPFDFIGFLLQVIFLTTGPVFYTAAVYVTISMS